MSLGMTGGSIYTYFFHRPSDKDEKRVEFCQVHVNLVLPGTSYMYIVALRHSFNQSKTLDAFSCH
jgi:hypothetical protein